MDIERFAAYERAKEHAGAVRAFYIVLGIYVVVNIGLFVIDQLTAGGPWFYWPLLGWGIGMVAFGLLVFLGGRRQGRDIDEERRIREYMEHGRS